MTSKRTMSGAMEAALAADVLRIVMFFRLDFASGVKRFNSDVGPITATHPVHGSESYLGLGDVGGLTAIKETVSGASEPIKLQMTGVDTTLVNDVETDDYFMRDADIMFGLYDQDFVEIGVVAPWSGYMERPGVALGTESNEITMRCIGRDALLDEASDWRVTLEDLQSFYSDDNGGEYIYKMQDVVLKWGGGNTVYRSATAGGSGSKPGARRYRNH